MVGSEGREGEASWRDSRQVASVAGENYPRVIGWRWYEVPEENSRNMYGRNKK